MATRKTDRSTPDKELAIAASVSAMVALAAACSVGSLNSYSLSPFFAPISRDLSVSVPVLGQVTTATWLLTAVVALTVGALADRYGHRLFLMCGLAAVMASTAGCAVAPDFGALFAARLFTAISAGILEGVTFAFAGVLFSHERRTQVFAILTSSLAVSSTFGTPLLTTIASVTSWRDALLVITVMAAITGLLVHHYLPGEDRTHHSESSFSVREVLDGYKAVDLSSGLVILLVASFLYAMPWQAFLTYSGAYFSLGLGFSTRAVGWAFCLASLSYVAGSLLVGGRIQRGSLHLMLALSVLGAGACLLCMMMQPWGAILGLAMTVGVCFSAGIAWVALTSLLTTGPESQYATILSVNVAVSTVGAAGGGALGGALLSVGGWQLFGLGLSGFALAAALLVVRAWQIRALSTTSVLGNA